MAPKYMFAMFAAPDQLSKLIYAITIVSLAALPFNMPYTCTVPIMKSFPSALLHEILNKSVLMEYIFF